MSNILRLTKLGEKHYTATIWIITQEEPKRVLMVHHKKYNIWVQPGGHIEQHENPVEAAIREVKEETQIDITPYIEKGKRYSETLLLPSPLFFLEEKIPMHNNEPEHFHLDFIYKVEVPFQEAIRQEKESHDIGWFTYEEAQNLTLFDSTRSMLKQMLQR
jgi:8-oxo-dGTP pyrophosphatase MutT (NUDIX family)